MAVTDVVTFTTVGPGWLARSAALSDRMAYMIYTGTIYPQEFADELIVSPVPSGLDIQASLNKFTPAK